MLRSETRNYSLRTAGGASARGPRKVPRRNVVFGSLHIVRRISLASGEDQGGAWKGSKGAQHPTRIYSTGNPYPRKSMGQRWENVVGEDPAHSSPSSKKHRGLRRPRWCIMSALTGRRCHAVPVVVNEVAVGTRRVRGPPVRGRPGTTVLYITLEPECADRTDTSVSSNRNLDLLPYKATSLR